MTRTPVPTLSLLALAGLVIAADAPPGYLPAGTAVDVTPIVPPPPRKGEIRYAADRKAFKATRQLLETPRGKLAAADVAGGIGEVMADFSCAAGITLSPAATPATARLLANASGDTGRATNAAKEAWQRKRPFLIDKGPTCEPQDELAKSYDYPSGHVTRGWTFGLVLSDLLPDRSSPLLVRARAFGESRLVCGAHNMSTIEASRLSATVTMQWVRATPGYQADLAAARNELAAARANGQSPNAATCQNEMALTRVSVLEGLAK